MFTNGFPVECLSIPLIDKMKCQQLCWHLIDTNQNLGHQLVESQLIFASHHWELIYTWVNWHSANFRPTVIQMPTRCWLGINWVLIEMPIKCWLSIDRLSIKMMIEHPLSVVQDVYQVWLNIDRGLMKMMIEHWLSIEYCLTCLSIWYHLIDAINWHLTAHSISDPRNCLVQQYF